MSARKRITAISQKNEEGNSRPRRKNPITFNFEANEENKRGNFPIYLRITENRKHRRYRTSIELSRKIDWNRLAQEIPPANISILKTGKAKAIRFSTLDALCSVLECSPGDILEFRPD